MSELWKVSYKLTKSFFGQQELMGPFRVATSLKAKVEKFKIRLPIITALCTAGMKDRHWDMMSKKVKYFENSIKNNRGGGVVSAMRLLPRVSIYEYRLCLPCSHKQERNYKSNNMKLATLCVLIYGILEKA